MKKIIKLDRFIKHKETREWVEALIFALAVAFFIRTWVYAPFRVPSGSMIPTIQQGDHLFANMHKYGFVIPFTDYKLFASNPKKGDVIIFPRPTNPEKCNGSFYSAYDTLKSLTVSMFSSDYIPECMDFIKRVVAVEGDRLTIDGEDIYINGEREQGYEPYFDPYYPPALYYRDEVVPAGKVFAMGDNRRNSNDSRVWGYVDQENVRAQASIIYLSFDPAEPFFLGFRSERVGIVF